MVTEKHQDWAYECPDCGQTFISPETFQKHTKKFHLKEWTACRKCPAYFNKLNQLFLHARQIHNIKTRATEKNCKLQCTFGGCTYQTNNGGLMKHHYRSHTDNKPYMCAICKKTFTQKSNMKTHFNRHKKNDFPFDCVVCEKSFNSYDILLSHLETREHFLGEFLSQENKVGYQCMVCEGIFDNPTNTFLHGESCQVSNRKQFVCTYCHESFNCDLEELNNHFQLHKNYMVCPLCNEPTIFTDKIKFNFHLTKKHNRKVDRRKSCRYCENIFPDEELRNAHVELAHRDIKNKHRSCETNGRIVCHFEDCNFKTNSEIFFQKHLNFHYKNLDPDSFYTMDNTPVVPAQCSNVPVKQEATLAAAEPVRKRGRPRLCDKSEMQEHQSSVLPKAEQISGVVGNYSEYEAILPTTLTELGCSKQRGRPRKAVKTVLGDQSPIENVKCRKRGRPKKIKLEEKYIGEIGIDMINNVCFGNQKDHVYNSVDNGYNYYSGTGDNELPPMLQYGVQQPQQGFIKIEETIEMFDA